MVDEAANVLDLRESGGCHAHDSIVRLCVGDVGSVQECRAVESDIHEGGLHAGKNTRDTSLVQVAHEPAAARALDVDLLHDAVLSNCGACFAWRNVDQNLYTQITCSDQNPAADVATLNSASSSAPSPLTTLAFLPVRYTGGAQQPGGFEQRQTHYA